jgi:hypothetical protein
MAPRSVRSACDRGSSTFLKVSHKMGDQNLLFQAPPCFGRHVKPLVPAAFAVVNTPVSRRIDVRRSVLYFLFSDFDIIDMHLLTWVAFGFKGYVTNTLYSIKFVLL